MVSTSRHLAVQEAADRSGRSLRLRAKEFKRLGDFFTSGWRTEQRGEAKQALDQTVVVVDVDVKALNLAADLRLRSWTLRSDPNNEICGHERLKRVHEFNSPAVWARLALCVFFGLLRRSPGQIERSERRKILVWRPVIKASQQTVNHSDRRAACDASGLLPRHDEEDEEKTIVGPVERRVIL